MDKDPDKPASNKNGKEWTAPIWAAVITGLVTLLVALFTFPPFQRIFDPPTPIPFSTIDYSQTPIAGATAINFFTPEQTITEAFTLVPTAIETATPILPSSTPTTGLPIGMQVILTANQTIGKSPLTIKLDARDSYLRAPDGTIFECRKGACSYAWYVYMNNVEFTKPQETRGTIEFRFEKKGTYFVSVYVCHGAENPICGNSGTAVIVE